MKRIILRLAVTAILVLALAEPVFAQGEVEQGPADAEGRGGKSICSFSGLNETPEDLDPELGGRTQSYGQLVKKDVIEPSVVKSGQGEFLPKGTPGGSPGHWCNPNNLSLK